MKSAFLFCLVLCAAWPLRPGQDRSKAGPDESRLLALECAWNLAEENKDLNALDQLLSDTLAYTDFDGTFMNKAQFLTSVKNSTPIPTRSRTTTSPCICTATVQSLPAATAKRGL